MITSQHLIHLAIIHNGNYHAIKKALENFEISPPFLYQRAITVLDEKYPNCLKHLTQPPFVLFYEGNLDLLSRPSISIVGSRHPSDYAVNVLKEGFKYLNPELTIVSGGALGIDCLAHQYALNHQMKSIWVCGHGLGRLYPKQHYTLYAHLKKEHLVISEYPSQSEALPQHFIHRNRIVVALSETLLVMSGTLKSGTMHSVKFALDLNKNIITIPHPINDSQGELCNHLIENGSGLLTNVTEFAKL
jgi:DNA processing protein